MKKRYTDEQIVKAIKKHEVGAKVEDSCRDLGISNGTFYNWRSTFSGMDVNEAKGLRELECHRISERLACSLAGLSGSETKSIDHRVFTLSGTSMGNRGL